jgi:alanyl-tRNA synthetase
MTVKGLREKYLAFFVSKGHYQFPSGSLVPYDVTGRLDESLLFNGAGMVQFKPYFRGTARPENPRLTTAQKCVRTGDIEEVGDNTHLTFFEMMGNFSFGDYFKLEAIDFSWEFLTSPEWLNLDPRRLAFTIYEEDAEAYEGWARQLMTAGIDPATRIFLLGEETNYWPAGSLTSGPPGPCGPNSEMFYWVSGEPPEGAYSREQYLEDDAQGNWVEIWNDVFIDTEWVGTLKNPSKPSDGYLRESLTELPFRSIDTGMGLERTAMVLGGFKSVYESDVFVPILAKIRALSPSTFTETASPAPILAAPNLDARIKAERIIADHIRTASFCIADGVFPSNNGRGYVLRRLIRRAVLQGERILGINKPFFADIFGGVLESMGSFYRELHERKDTILETFASEESQFRRTLSSGATLLEQELGQLQPGRVLPGAIAFKLYDTFGFPLEITREIALEGGFQVDLEGYEVAMAEAQQRSRSSQSREAVYGAVEGVEEWAVQDAPITTAFVGYSDSQCEAKIVRLRRLGATRWHVVLDQSPFYAESGGQVGDQGSIVGDFGFLPVLNTTKNQGIYWHDVQYEGDAEDLLGERVLAKVDQEHRAKVQRNHTATHLLHAALRKVLGSHVAQAGSFVGPDSLRFDFSHGHALTTVELAEVEEIVNRQALSNLPVITHVDLPIDEARQKGAMALFGEKYGNLVRMVEIGEFSRELCGGTHVRTTGEVGLFKVLAEGSAAGGIRRIEAVTGEGAYHWALDQASVLKEASGLLRTTPPLLLKSIERVLEQIKEERRKREQAELLSINTGMISAAGQSKSLAFSTINPSGIELGVKNYGEISAKVVANELDNAIALNPNRLGVVASISEGKVILYAKAGHEAIEKGAHAGNILKEIAGELGGSGGGRAEFATAGGKDVHSVDRVFSSLPQLIERVLS